MLPAFAAPARDLPGGIPIATSFIYPVGSANAEPTWNPANGNGYYLTQGFNTSCDPSLGQGFYMYGSYYCGHSGVDLATNGANAVVHATAAGVVTAAGYLDSYGVMVRIKHLLADGSYVYSQYEHMAYGSLAVYQGETLSQGQQLGLVGATGFVTGAHLHFEIKTVDENGFGYTFGNSSLIAGYLEPLSFVAAHQVMPVAFNPGPGHAVQVWPAESDLILKRFLTEYRHFVVVSVPKKVGGQLRVRSGPSAHAKVLGVVLRGAKLGYVSTQGDWLKVALPQHVVGWVSRAYVAGYQDWNHPVQARFSIAHWTGPVATVDAAVAVGLNVHAGPGQDHPIITSVFQGDRVPLLQRTTSWAQVMTRDGTRGWVLRRYLDEPGVSHAALTTQYLVAATAVLTVRSGPGLQYPATGAAYRGTQMQLVRETPHWAAVILPGGTTGWVARPYTVQGSAGQTGIVQARATSAARATSVSRPATTNATAVSPATAATYIKVAAGVLNIRSAPGQSHPVVAQVLRGTRLEVLSVTTNWAHVALPVSRIAGWVLRRYTR